VSAGEPNSTYYWRVLAEDGRRGGNQLSATSQFETDELSAILTGENVIPTEFVLHQNYPNPFNPTTHIVYDVKTTAAVELTVYNLLGQRVATLVNSRKNAGRYVYQYDGAGIASGIYIYQVKISSEQENFIQHKKMVLIK
jgi:hypothetical protein